MKLAPLRHKTHELLQAEIALKLSKRAVVQHFIILDNAFQADLDEITFNSPPSTTAAPFKLIAVNLGIFGTMTSVLLPDGDGHVVGG